MTVEAGVEQTWEHLDSCIECLCAHSVSFGIVLNINVGIK